MQNLIKKIEKLRGKKISKFNECDWYDISEYIKINFNKKHNIMTQEEKAQEIGKQWYFDTMNPNEVAYKASIQMAKWKESQMIEKACQWLQAKNRMCMFEIEMILGKDFIEDFKKAMEE